MRGWLIFMSPEKQSNPIIPLALDFWNVSRASRLRAYVVRFQVRGLIHISSLENP